MAGWRQAIEAFQKAIGLDPRYAEAHAELAVSEYSLGDLTGDLTLFKSADQSAQKAIDLDPGLAVGYATRGYLRIMIHHDWVGADADFQKAMALDPTNARVLSRYGVMLVAVGRLQESIAIFRKVLATDPLDSAAWQRLGLALIASRDYPAAYDAFHHALAIRPDDSFNKQSLATLQLVDGKAREALATAQGIAFDDFRNAAVAMAEHSLGDAPASQQALEKLIATAAGHDAYQIAEIYAWRGEMNLAFEWLERAYRQQDGGLDWLKADPLFASLRTDPRYAALLRKCSIFRLDEGTTLIM